ncbi:hypothetical protein [Candidiatus Paracoxiella cheracis]|uniref:hypothetical protein n=1 Tax=Candidiatus Paracoxiella cheracis TaxID=3405120 RepID=UPI003BF5F9CB
MIPTLLIDLNSVIFLRSSKKEVTLHLSRGFTELLDLMKKDLGDEDEYTRVPIGFLVEQCPEGSDNYKCAGIGGFTSEEILRIINHEQKHFEFGEEHILSFSWPGTLPDFSGLKSIDENTYFLTSDSRMRFQCEKQKQWTVLDAYPYGKIYEPDLLALDTVLRQKKGKAHSFVDVDDTLLWRARSQDKETVLNQAPMRLLGKNPQAKNFIITARKPTSSVGEVDSPLSMKSVITACEKEGIVFEKVFYTLDFG